MIKDIILTVLFLLGAVNYLLQILKYKNEEYANKKKKYDLFSNIFLFLLFTYLFVDGLIKIF